MMMMIIATVVVVVAVVVDDADYFDDVVPVDVVEFDYCDVVFSLI